MEALKHLCLTISLWFLSSGIILFLLPLLLLLWTLINCFLIPVTFLWTWIPQHIFQDMQSSEFPVYHFLLFCLTPFLLHWLCFLVCCWFSPRETLSTKLEFSVVLEAIPEAGLHNNGAGGDGEGLLSALVRRAHNQHACLHIPERCWWLLLLH